MALFVLWLYQKTLILRQPSCRFYPSCSQYMAVGIRRFGFFRGLFLGLKRLCKCHPYHEGGIDDVPDHFSLLR
ncbi:MAG: membrane protein insertion efficiency factor YidD [Candidatus Melainabacteria bacterium]|nr:membrane protein insertion efficiency factor YidD [Candidatus Melainabacteria bacterium]